MTGGKGTGVFYWEPQCYGNWQGYSLGAFDNNGMPTVAMDAFKNITNLQNTTNDNLRYKIDSVNKRIVFNKPLQSIEVYNTTGVLIFSITNQDSFAMQLFCKGVNIMKIREKGDVDLQTVKFLNE